MRHFLASLSAVLTPVTVPVNDATALLLLEEDLIALFKQCPFGLFLEALFAQGVRHARLQRDQSSNALHRRMTSPPCWTRVTN